MPHRTNELGNPREHDEVEKRIECEAKGGRYALGQDGKFTCFVSGDVANPDTPETFPGGVTLPDGRTFTNLSPDEIAEIVARETARGKPPEGSKPFGTTQARLDKQAEVGELLASQQGRTQDTEAGVKEGGILQAFGDRPSGPLTAAENILGQSQGLSQEEIDAGRGVATLTGVGAALVATTTSFLLGAFARSGVAPVAGAARGSRALGTNPRALGTNPRAVATGVLQAPTKAIASSKKLSTTAKTLLGFVGLSSAGKISSSLINRNVDRIEAEVTKVGEQLTKIPEAHSLGFSIDEDGNLFEYTDDLALSNINEVEDSLEESERALQTVGIGTTILKLTGRFNTAQAEIDKQKEEIIVARGKILRNIANPTPAIENTRDLFRQFAVEEES